MVPSCLTCFCLDIDFGTRSCTVLQHRRRPHERRDGFAVGTHSQQFYMSNFFANYEATSEALRATLKIWPCDLVQLSLALALAWPSLHDVVDAGAIEAASSNLLQENVIIKSNLHKSALCCPKRMRRSPICHDITRNYFINWLRVVVRVL